MNHKVIPALALAFSLFGAVSAEALTLLQENLMGMPNKFEVRVTLPEGEGALSKESIKAMVEQQLTALGILVAKEKSAPPIGYVNVNIARRDEPEGKAYMVDLNIYNHSTISTAYRLRKGTVWMMGSVKVVPGADFPADVERNVTQLIQYFIQDYFAANPDLAQ